MILSALDRNALDPKRAAIMLYNLQVATAVTRSDLEGTGTCFVETEIARSPDGSDLAPDPALALVA